MSGSMNEVERELIESSEAARRRPSAGLRARTLAAISAIETSPSRRPVVSSRVLAAAALLALAATSALVIQPSLRRSGPAEVRTGSGQHVFVIPHLETDPAMAVLRRVSLSTPLEREARLLGRDVQRTIDHFRDLWPRIPQLETSPGHPHPAERDTM